jgi:hypothetical protein
MFKFKKENFDANIKEVKQKLQELPTLISELKCLEVGVDFSHSDRSFDLSLYSSFSSKQDLQSYANHPKHLEVVEFIKLVTTESKVVDYMIGDTK